MRDKIRTILLLLILCLTPVVSYLHYVPIPDSLGRGFYPDVFFWIKDKIIWGLSFGLLFCLPSKFKFEAELLCFALLLGIAMAFSPSPEVSLLGNPKYGEGLVTILCYIIIFIAAGELKDEALWKGVLGSVSLVGVSCILQSIFANYPDIPILRTLSGFTTEQGHGPRFPLFGSLGNPNHLGLYCALLFPLLVNLREYSCLYLLLAMGLGSESRACWISILVVSPFVLPKKARLPALGILVAGIAVFWHRLFLGSSGRIYMWSHTLPLLGFFGKGPGSLIFDFPQNDTAEKLALHWPAHTMVDRPHNIYLQIMHMAGIPALLPLGLIVGKILKRRTIYTPAIIGFLICAFFTDSVVSVTPLFCVILGVASTSRYFEYGKTPDKFVRLYRASKG